MNQSLTQANFATTIRYFLSIGLTYAAAKGWITSDAVTNFGVLATAAIPMLWAYYTNYSKKVTADANVTAAVQAGVAHATNPDVATTIPSAISPLEAKSIVAAYAVK